MLCLWPVPSSLCKPFNQQSFSKYHESGSVLCVLCAPFIIHSSNKFSVNVDLVSGRVPGVTNSHKQGAAPVLRDFVHHESHLQRNPKGCIVFVFFVEEGTGVQHAHVTCPHLRGSVP